MLQYFIAALIFMALVFISFWIMGWDTTMLLA